MILSYSNTDFPALIDGGIKLHTFREDAGRRWKAGNSIQHWMYNPRHVKLKPYRFAKERDDLNVCKAVQDVLMIYEGGSVIHLWFDGKPYLQPIHTVAKNDGFGTVREFTNWFFPFKQLGEKRLRLIHWTDLKY